jgi:hypothetical protein
MRRLSQITPENISSEATKSCNDLNDYLKKTVKRNIIFCKLDLKSLYVVFYSDASFAGNLGLPSKIGGIILLKDKHGNDVEKKVGPTQRTLMKFNHKVTQMTKLINDLPQTWCVLRCRVKSSCSGPDDMCASSVLGTDFTFKSAKPVGVILDSSLGRL